MLFRGRLSCKEFVKMLQSFSKVRPLQNRERSDRTQLEQMTPMEFNEAPPILDRAVATALKLNE